MKVRYTDAMVTGYVSILFISPRGINCKNTINLPLQNDGQTKINMKKHDLEVYSYVSAQQQHHEVLSIFLF